MAFSKVHSYSDGICRWQIWMRARTPFRWHIQMKFAYSERRWHIQMSYLDSLSDGRVRFTFIFMWRMKMCNHIQMADLDALVSLSDGIFRWSWRIQMADDRLRWSDSHSDGRSRFTFRWHIQIYIHINMAYPNVISYSDGRFRWQIQMHAPIALRWHIQIHFAYSDGTFT